MWKQISVVFAITLILYHPLSAHGASMGCGGSHESHGSHDSGHEMHMEKEDTFPRYNVSLLAGMAFPTGLNTYGNAIDYMNMSFNIGVNFDVELMKYLMAGLDFGYIRIKGSTDLVANSSSKGDLFATSVHLKGNAPLGEKFRVNGGIGAGPYVTDLRVTVAGATSSDTDTVMGLNGSVAFDWLMMKQILMGLEYKAHIIFDPDDKFVVHALGMRMGARF